MKKNNRELGVFFVWLQLFPSSSPPTFVFVIFFWPKSWSQKKVYMETGLMKSIISDRINFFHYKTEMNFFWSPDKDKKCIPADPITKQLEKGEGRGNNIFRSFCHQVYWNTKWNSSKDSRDKCYCHSFQTSSPLTQNLTPETNGNKTDMVSNKA